MGHQERQLFLNRVPGLLPPGPVPDQPDDHVSQVTGQLRYVLCPPQRGTSVGPSIPRYRWLRSASSSSPATTTVRARRSGSCSACEGPPHRPDHHILHPGRSSGGPGPLSFPQLLVGRGPAPGKLRLLRALRRMVAVPSLSDHSASSRMASQPFSGLCSMRLPSGYCTRGWNTPAGR